MTHDTTPTGIYECLDAKRLLAAMNFIVNEVFEDGDDNQQHLFGLIDAITATLDEAIKAIETREQV
jgi:hypothetical protein